MKLFTYRKIKTLLVEESQVSGSEFTLGSVAIIGAFYSAFIINILCKFIYYSVSIKDS